MIMTTTHTCGFPHCDNTTETGFCPDHVNPITPERITTLAAFGVLMQDTVQFNTGQRLATSDLIADAVRTLRNPPSTKLPADVVRRLMLIDAVQEDPDLYEYITLNCPHVMVETPGNHYQCEFCTATELP